MTKPKNPKVPPSEKNPEPITEQALKEKAQQKLDALLKSREVTDEGDETEEVDDPEEEPEA